MNYRLSALGYQNYDEYLSSEHWKAFRARYRFSSKPKSCLVCNNGKYQLHHITYERLGAEILDDVVPICSTCHGKLHALHVKRDVPLREYSRIVAFMKKNMIPCKNKLVPSKREINDRNREINTRVRELYARHWTYQTISIETGLSNRRICHILGISPNPEKQKLKLEARKNPKKKKKSKNPSTPTIRPTVLSNSVRRSGDRKPKSN